MVLQRTIGKYFRNQKKRYGKRPAYAKAIASAASSFRVAGSRMSPLQDLLFNDVIGGGVTVDSTTGVVLLNGLGQGDSDGQRTGSKIRVHSVEGRWRLFLPTVVNNTSFGTAVRLLLVYDKQANGAAPATNDILDTASPFAGKNIGKRERFIIIYDKLLCLERFSITGGTANTGNSAVCGKVYRKFMADATFTSSASGVGAISTGALYFVFVGQGAGTSDLAAIDYNMRIRYQD